MQTRISHIKDKPLFVKISLPNKKGTAKSGETKNANTHENPLIVTFTRTSANTDKGWGCRFNPK
jgi:hypothetical protein